MARERRPRGPCPYAVGDFVVIKHEMPTECPPNIHYWQKRRSVLVVKEVASTHTVWSCRCSAAEITIDQLFEQPSRLEHWLLPKDLRQVSNTRPRRRLRVDR